MTAAKRASETKRRRIPVIGLHKSHRNTHRMDVGKHQCFEGMPEGNPCNCHRQQTAGQAQEEAHSTHQAGHKPQLSLAPYPSGNYSTALQVLARHVSTKSAIIPSRPPMQGTSFSVSPNLGFALRAKSLPSLTWKRMCYATMVLVNHPD